MEPEQDFKGEIHVGWHGGMVGEDKWIGVSGLSGDYWCKGLAKEIVVEEGIQLTSYELAAHCLWEITFYGFSEDEISNTFDRMLGRNKPQNKYEIALDKLEESIWKHQMPRRLRSRGTYGERLITLEFPLRWGNRINRSSFTRQDVDYLLEVEQGRQCDYTAVVSGTEGRLQYILDSMTRYQQLDLSQYNNAIVCITASSRYPLSENEVEDFKSSVRALLKYDDIRFGLIQTEEDKPEVRVNLLLNKTK